MVIFEKELNTKHIKNVIVQEQKNKIKIVRFNTHKKMVSYHRASDDIYFFGSGDDSEMVEIFDMFED